MICAQLDLSSDGLDLTQRLGRAAVYDFISSFADVDELVRILDAGPFIDGIVLDMLATRVEAKWIRALVLDGNRNYDHGNPQERVLMLVSDRGNVDVGSAGIWT